MTLAPILAASFPVKLHLVAALVALGAVGAQFAGAKHGARHRVVGWIGVGALALAALSSFWIAEIRHGNFSPIHILSVVMLVTLTRAIVARRQGRISAHRKNMIGATLGLVGAGLFTLLPGRILFKALF